MNIRYLKLGQVAQFLPSEGKGTLTSCIIKSIRLRENTVTIDYVKDGKVIRGAMIHVSDLVSDEDQATHDIP